MLRVTAASLAVLGLISTPKLLSAQATQPTLTWDRATLRFAAPGGYARMARLQDGRTLLTYEHRGRSYVKRSDDGGRTWDESIVAATCDFGSASNP